MALRRRSRRVVSTGMVCAGLLLSAGAAGVSAAAVPGRASLPDLVITTVATSTHRVTAGHQVTVSDTTKNAGPGRAGASTTGYYLSKDKARSRSDKLLGSRAVAKLAARAKANGKKALTVPSATASGTYFVLACADAKKVVRETHESNNCRAAAALTVVRPAPPPPPPPPSTDVGPNQTGRDLLLAQAGPMKLLSSPPPTSDLTATSTFEDAHAVTQTIGQAGGQIAVTDDAGDHITVTFPANALLAPVAITATPVATTQGVDAVNAHPVGVRLEPSGLGLMQQATMAVVPANGITDVHAEGMISASDGTDVNPAMLLPDTSKLAVPVDHFTMVTVLVPNGDGTTTTRYFTQTEYTATLHNALVQAIEDARDTAVDTGHLVDINATIVAASNAYWNDVAVPLLNESKTNCTFARANLVTVEAAAHSDEILGIARPAMGPGLAAALQNCWKEATATCMTMSPSRYSEVVALARQMDLLGVLTSDGHEPDPFNLDWCGTANGFFRITRTEDTEIVGGGNSQSKQAVTQAVVLFSGTAYKNWNQDGTFEVFANGANPTNSWTDLTANYTDQETWSTGPDTTCTIDLSAHPVLNETPTGVSLPQRAYSASTGVATTTQGLSITGFPVTIPEPDGTLSGTDTCDSTLPGPYYFDWWTPTINQQYTLSVDAAKGDVNTAWNNTVSDGDGYTHTVHYAIDANIHIDGLKAFLAAGPP